VAVVPALARARRASVAILFAAGAVPMIGLMGLAVDYAIWNQANSGLGLAANVAALTAVKVAADAQLAADPNWQAEGQAAGLQWFEAQVGSFTQPIVGTTPVTITTTGPSPGLVVTVNWVPAVGATPPAVVATVTYSGTVGSIFGAMFGKNWYGVSGGATAQVSSSPYLDVEIMLDNSGSMEIGAGPADIAALQQLTPCTPAIVGQNAPGAVYDFSPTNTLNAGGQAYSAYNYDGYDGSPPAPFPAGPPLTFAQFLEVGNGVPGPSCQGTPNLPSIEGVYPTAGPPCAFACHFDSHYPAGSGNDFYALARSTIGSAQPITLRFDLVKAAVNKVLEAMAGDNIASISNLQVGIFTFAKDLLQIYPVPGCEVGTLACAAGNDWTTAETLVGAPPTTKNGADTGIQPYLGTNGGNSDFHGAMATLLTYMTAAGPGVTAAAPRKVLFLVTDGVSDVGSQGDPTRAYGSVDPRDCGNFKQLGFTIYVVYTPYYPVMNGFYLNHIKPLVEPAATSTVAANLQACASSPGDYLAATDRTGLDHALQYFLKSAIMSPARFTT
jgi:Flp pilus assembly protein TadG